MPPAQQQQSQCSCGTEDRLKRVLMVRRLHPAVTMQMLLQTFGVFGSVTGCKVFTHKSGRSAGCASLEFSTHQAACAALKGLQNTVLHGKHITLQWFDQSLSSATSPVARAPGQRSELQGGIMSEGGSYAANNAGRQLSSGPSSTGAQRSTAASCPGMSPFGIFAAAAAPGPHPFCNSTAAMAAAAAAAAAVAAQQQQQQQQHLQHPGEQHAAAAAALLASHQHQLPPLMVQQLQRQVSAPLSAFGQLSPTGAHIPPSPLTPASHGGGWEALMSPAGAACGQQPFAQQQHQQQRESAASSRGGGMGNDQPWGTAAGHSPAGMAAAAAAAKLSAAMSTGSIGSAAAQDSLNMAASLQQLASMQQHALAYAAWQNQQHAAAALLQHQFSAQLPTSPLHQAQMHLLGARSMPSELGNGLSADFLLQQATASLQQVQQQQQQQHGGLEAGDGSKAAGRAPGGGRSGGSLSRQHSTPAATGQSLLSACEGAVGCQAAGYSGGGADSIPAANAGSSMDQQAHPGGLRARSPGGCAGHKGGTGAAGSGSDGTATGGCSSSSKAGSAEAKKHLQWEDQRQHLLGDRSGAAGASDGSGGRPAAGGKGASGGSSGADGRAPGRTSTHPTLLRGYSGSDDIANVAPDVNALANALAATRQQQQQDATAHAAAAAAAAAAAVSSCYLSSPTWLTLQKQAFSATQITPELMASLQGPSLGGMGSSQGLSRSPSAAAVLQTQQQQHQQHNLMLAAAAVAAAGGGSGAAGSHGGGGLTAFANSQQQGPAARGGAHDQATRGSGSSQVMPGGAAADGSYSSAGMLFSSPSLPGPTAVSAALDAMSVAAATAAAQSWQQQQQQQQSSQECAEAPASETFKHKHKMHLQLPTESSGGPPGKASLSGGSGDGFDQLITTEVLPESPASKQQQQPSPLEAKPAAAAAEAAGGTGTAWADWSASMAALLSPAHVSSLAGRRFEDFMQLQQAAQGAAAAQGLGPGSTRMQPQSLPGVLEAAALLTGGAGKLASSTSSQAAWLLQDGRCSEQQQGCGPAASREPGSLMTGAGSDMFASSAPGDAGFEGGAGSMLGKTRHNSLCLDSRPGLLTLSHMFQEPTHQQVSARPSPRGLRAGSPQQQAQQQLQQAAAAAMAAAAAHRGLPGDLGAAAATAGGCGSFTFQPPVLRGLQGSALAGGGGGNSSNLMICQPFQLPDFFNRESRMNCPSPRGSISTPGAATTTTAAAGPASGRSSGREPPPECVGSPLHPAGMQHQLSASLDGTRIAESSFSTSLDSAGRAPGSPCAARNLQHAYSMPARFSAPGGAGDALAAAAAAAACAVGAQQQHGDSAGELSRPGTDHLGGQLKRQQSDRSNPHASYGDVFNTIWGPTPQ